MGRFTVEKYTEIWRIFAVYVPPTRLRNLYWYTFIPRIIIHHKRDDLDYQLGVFLTPTSPSADIPERHRDGVQRICQVHGLDLIAPRQIRDRARQLQYTVIPACTSPSPA